MKLEKVSNLVATLRISQHFAYYP